MREYLTLLVLIVVVAFIASSMIQAQCYIVNEVPRCEHNAESFPCCGNPWPNPPTGSCCSEPSTGVNTTFKKDDAPPGRTGQTGYNRSTIPDQCAFYAVLNCTPPCGHADQLSTIDIFLDELTGAGCTGQ